MAASYKDVESITDIALRYLDSLTLEKMLQEMQKSISSSKNKSLLETFSRLLAEIQERNSKLSKLK